MAKKVKVVVIGQIKKPAAKGARPGDARESYPVGETITVDAALAEKGLAAGVFAPEGHGVPVDPAAAQTKALKEELAEAQKRLNILDAALLKADVSFEDLIAQLTEEPDAGKTD